MYIKRNIKWISFIVLFAFIILFCTKRRRTQTHSERENVDLEYKVKSKYCFSITRTYTHACTWDTGWNLKWWKWVSSLCSMWTIFYSMAWKKDFHTFSPLFSRSLSLSFASFLKTSMHSINPLLYRLWHFKNGEPKITRMEILAHGSGGGGDGRDL